ncbi:MAG: hypothetical protein ACK4ND_20110 [Cytophagaceae bacterium]
MKRYIIIIITFILSQTTLFGQKRIESLSGEWQLVSYFSPKRNGEFKNSQENGCENFLIIKFKEKNKFDLIFTDHKDSIVFSGKLILQKNGQIKIKNNIHEIIYLGELEKCISAPLRMELRGIFHRTFKYLIQDNQLLLIFNLPEDLQGEKQMTFQQLN